MYRNDLDLLIHATFLVFISSLLTGVQKLWYICVWYVAVNGVAEWVVEWEVSIGAEPNIRTQIPLTRTILRGWANGIRKWLASFALAPAIEAIGTTA